MHKPPYQKATGFTLIELMVTLTVAAILAGLAAPSFKSLIQSTTLTTVTNQLIATFAVARSEAIKLGTPVRISAIDDSLGWNSGWQITKLHADGSVCDPTEDCLIRQFDAIKPGYSIDASDTDSASTLTYLPSGLLAASSGEEFTYHVCADNYAVQKQVTVSETGRASSATIQQACL